MSLKPPKKSDAHKTWMKQRQDRKIRLQPEYHLIVTEGTKTEPQYFQSVKDVINRNYRGRIRLDIYGEGDNTLSLFEKAKNRISQSSIIFSHVWIVYDTDDFPADHVNRTAEMCKDNSNCETEFHAIWSNQCIELWYLLHFSYYHSDTYRWEYWPKLSAVLKKKWGSVNMQKGGLICMRYCVRIWIRRLRTPDFWMRKMRGNHRPMRRQGQRYLS